MGAEKGNVIAPSVPRTARRQPGNPDAQHMATQVNMSTKASVFTARWPFHSSCSDTHWAQKCEVAFVRLWFSSSCFPQDKALLFAVELWWGFLLGVWLVWFFLNIAITGISKPHSNSWTFKVWKNVSFLMYHTSDCSFHSWEGVWRSSDKVSPAQEPNIFHLDTIGTITRVTCFLTH